MSSRTEKKKNIQGNFLILVVLIYILPVIQGLWDTWRKNILQNDILEHYVYETVTDEEVLPVDTDTEYITELSDDSYLSSWINSGTGKIEYALSAGHGQAFVGTEIEPGNILFIQIKKK